MHKLKKILSKLKKIKIKKGELRKETQAELQVKIRKIANELALGEEQMIVKNVFLTHCPHCNQKNVMRISYINAIFYECKTGCNFDDIEKAVIGRFPFAKPWVPGFSQLKIM